MKIAVIGDIHIHETLVPEQGQIFSDISEEADILLVCGDITQGGMPKEAEQLAYYLKTYKIPVLAVLGNHDHHHGHQEEIKQILAPNITFLENGPYEKDGIGFVGTKGFGGGFNNRMLSLFGENATKSFVTEAVNEALKLENDLRSLKTSKNVAILHYSPIEETVVGEPEQIFPFLGCSRFAETLDRFEISFIAHGHAHIGTHSGKTPKGTPVYNCAVDVCQKNLQKPYKIIEL